MIKVLRSILLVCLLLIFVLPNFKATSLIGTSSIVYENSLYTFEDGDQARGFICLNGGFEVPVYGGVRLSLSMPVRNLMALNTTGSVILESNLTLDPGVVLDSGGIVNGGGYTLILGGDLTIPALTTIKTTSTLTIDGEGHTLFIDNFGQLLVDSHSTLTLKNIVIKNDFNSSAYPAIALNNADSKLAFDNVKMAFSNDFWINTGEVFFHNKVNYTGNTALVYHSPQTSFIAPNSSLQFDKNTRFFYLPQNTESNILQMQDDTSDLFLDGCSVESTPTGLTLSRGRVFFANQVDLLGGLDYISSLDVLQGILYGSNVAVVAWSPDGEYLAIGGENQDSYVPGQDIYLIIYKFNPSSYSPLSQVASVYYGDAGSAAIYTISWSPDGNYIAIGGTNPSSSEIFTTQALRIYEFTRAISVLQARSGAFYGTAINSVDWSNSGNYIAVGGSGATATDGFSDTNNVKVYAFNRVNATLTANASFNFAGQDVYSVKLRFTEDYLAVAGNADNSGYTINICSFNPYQSIMSLRLVQACRLISMEQVNVAKWSEDGQYLALGGFNNAIPNETTGLYEQFQIYNFDPSLTSSLSYLSGYTLPYFPQEQVFSIDWNNDGSSIALGSQVNSAFIGQMTAIFNFNVDNPYLTLSKTSAYFNHTGQASSVAWHPSGLFLAQGRRMGRYTPPALLGGALLLYRFKGNAEQFSDSKLYTNNVDTDDGIQFVSWTDDGKYLAVAGTGAASVGGFDNNDDIRVYSFDFISETLTPVASISSDLVRSGDLKSMEWRPDGKYLSISYYQGFAVYSFDGSNLEYVTSSTFPYPVYINQISWHPNGTLLAGGQNGNSSAPGAGFLYSFDGNSLSGPFGWNDNSEDPITNLKWSKSGNYLAVCKNDASLIEYTVFGEVWELNDGSFTTVAITDPYYPETECDIQWRLDDNLIVLSETSTSHFYSFSTNVLTFLFDNFAQCYGCKLAFSPDGRAFAIAGDTGDYADNYYLLSISVDQLDDEYLFSARLRGTPKCIAWQPNGNYLAIGLTHTLNNIPNLYVVKINKLMNPFPLSGPKGIDLDYSLKTNIFGDAQVNINGVVNYVS